jgi:hypothetical protein
MIEKGEDSYLWRRVFITEGSMHAVGACTLWTLVKHVWHEPDHIICR